MPTPDLPPPRPRQVVPRPPSSRPGGPAPWAGLSAAERRGVSLGRVLAALADDAPARRASGSASAGGARSLAGTGRFGAAAVLVALFEEAGESRVVLTVRSPDLRAHSGEVAFPGGRLDPGETVVGGALREAYEEVALAPSLVTVVAELGSLPTVSSNTVMTPVVATLGARPSLAANPGEVVRVFDVALTDLLADGAFHEEWWSVAGRPRVEGLPGGEFPVWFFDVSGETVWGATARILVDLLCAVLDLDRPPTLRP